MRIAGLHLLQPLDLVATPRRSALAEVDADGRLLRLDLLADDGDILAALPSAPAVVAVDAPLVVPDEGGRRDAEAVLAWCDVPAFPSSRRRLHKAFGGLRGVDLAPAIATGGRRVVETLPDLVLRQIAWEAGRGAAPPLPLVEYRAAWLDVRPPAYRAKGRGRAHPAGLGPARDVLAGVLDLAGWRPGDDPDPWTAVHDSARLDALACAALALRLHREPARTLTLGTPERGQIVLPVDANLAERVAVNLARLREEGAVRI